MAVELFILGRPGSGKTTAARYISGLARDRRWSSIHINDYTILQEMFQTDTENKFRPTQHNGFDVVDFSVLDTALQEVEKRVEEYISSMELVTIEFARDDYSKALKQFSPDFLKDAYFLFIDADVETCLQRIHKRVAHPTTVDDHPSLSDDCFRVHYRKDNRPYITSNFKTDYSIDDKRVTIIDNTDSWEKFGEELKQFAENILQGASLLVPAGT